MEKSLGIGIAVGITASIFMNVGKGIQKQKVAVLKKGAEMFSAPYRRDFLIWFAGVLMAISSAAFYSISLKFTDKSSIVASLSGVGLVGLLVYAKLILKESLGPRELFSSFLIISGTGIISYFDQPLSEGQRYNLNNLVYTVSFMVVIFALLSSFSFRFQRFWGVSFGLIAGSFIGLAMVLADMALVRSAGSLLMQFKNPYVYLAILSSLLALAITQVAFFRATAVVVVPTINSFIILTPLLVEYFTFSTLLNFLQYLGVAIVIIGIVLLTTSPRQLFYG